MSDTRITYLLLSILACVTMIPFWFYLRSPKRDMFEPVYWATAYFILLFIVRSIYDLTYGSEFLGTFPFDERTHRAFNLALACAIPGFMIFLLGYYAQIGTALARALPRMPQTWTINKIHIVLSLMLATGLVSYFLLIRSFGGWASYISNKEETLTAGGQGYLLHGMSLITVAYALSLTRTTATGKGKVLTYAILFPLIMGIGFFSGSKGMFLTPILIFLILMHYLKGRISPRHIIILVILAALLFPIFNAYRHIDNISKMPDAIARVGADASAELVTRNLMSRFYGIDSLTFIIRDTPEELDFQLGKTLLPLAYAWIPRQMWEGKPVISFGKIFSQTYYKDFFFGTGTAASPTILGEAYLNWHVGGMLLISFLCGFIIRTCYHYFIRRNFGSLSVFMYSVLFLNLFIFWESSIAGFLAARAMEVFLLVIIVGLISQRRPRTEHSCYRIASDRQG